MRVKSPRRARHIKVLKQARGYRLSRHRWYKVSREAVLHAGQHAFIGRRLRRRDLRRTWIVRIKAALENMGLKYSRFIPALKKADIRIDRKILSELATNQPDLFKKIVTVSGLAK